MGSDMGISGNADVAGFVELKNAIKITSDIQIKLKAYIDGELMDIDPVPYNFNSSGMPMRNPTMGNFTPDDIQNFILGSKIIIRDAYSPYTDDNNIILSYIEQDIYTDFPELAAELDDIIIEIQERTKNKKELSGSGKSRTYKRKDLDLFVRTFDMKRFL